MSEEKEQVQGKADLLYVIFMFISGYLFWEFIKLSSLGAGVTAFTALFLAATLAYFIAKKATFNIENIIYIILVLAAAVYYALFDNSFIEFFMIFVVSGYTVFMIGSSLGKMNGKGISRYIFGDIINLTLIIPFTNFNQNFKICKNVGKKNKASKEIKAAICGVVCMLPIIIIVLVLLTNADAAFENLMDKINEVISIDWGMIWKMILAIPTGCYFGGLIFGCVRKDEFNGITKESQDNSFKALKFAPRITVCSALISINFIYVVFIASQFQYLFNAMNESVPKGFTPAEYARRGFFEILVIVGINLAVLLVTHILIKDKDDDKTHTNDIYGVHRIMSTMLCVFTIILIGTAVSKVYLYISIYGLTYLRTYSTWFLMFLLFIVLVETVRQFKQFNSTKFVVIGGAVALLVLGYADVDGIIAKHNIDRYIEKVKIANLKEDDTKEPKLDFDCLAKLSDGAAPYLEKLYYSEYADEEIKDNVIKILCNVYGYLYRDLEHISFPNEKKETFRNYNLQTMKARKIRDRILEEEYNNVMNNKEISNEAHDAKEVNVSSEPIADICFDTLSNESWDKDKIYIYAYYKNSDGSLGECNAEWPGVLMEEYMEDVMIYDIPKNLEGYDLKIIFNNGKSGEGNQVPEFTGYQYTAGSYMQLNLENVWMEQDN